MNKGTPHMHQKEFVAKDGQTYSIRLNDSGEEISVFQGTEPMGVIDLKRVRMPSGIEYYLLTVLDLEKCKRKGIGEASLRYHQEIFRRPLTANGDVREGRRSSGSQITREGVLFIQKMRMKEVVAPEEFHDAFSEDE
ncbi:hypothetical protein SAMN05192566_1830 [Methylophilus rhizosphaerae]|uniref:N-acetyltransferase domain-containing protein n=1 Tax=Methylophilus rhizosphaerae TaxID=492660 RepID=A0A1G9D7M0_9PROT|nr:hypothetical protein [Methylophilus rhizosphaerae]SDK59936.1 hypothetical protein SAMN05192566_1830 [Methylophilus rhizosphaerae]